MSGRGSPPYASGWGDGWGFGGGERFGQGEESPDIYPLTREPQPPDPITDGDGWGIGDYTGRTRGRGFGSGRGAGLIDYHRQGWGYDDDYDPYLSMPAEEERRMKAVDALGAL